MTTCQTRVLLAVLASFAASPVCAQRKFPPDSLANVKVIPKNTPMVDVIAIMRNFTGYLGVRCTYCHVGEESQPLTAYDFVSDEKRAKQVARVMLQMVNAINGEHLTAIPSRSSPVLNVTCETCHRGVPRPVPIERIMEEALGAGGIDSASRAYKSLLLRFERRGSFNFSDAPLSAMARSMARTRFPEAMGLLALNEETHPTSAGAPTTRGDILLIVRNDTTGAIAAYRAALQKDSTFAQARAQLRALGKIP